MAPYVATVLIALTLQASAGVPPSGAASPGPQTLEVGETRLQEGRYETWLRAAQLSPPLQMGGLVQRKGLDSEPLYELFLSFDADSQSWDRLDAEFARVHGLKLRERLVFKLLHLLEVSPGRASLFIHGQCFDLELRITPNGTLKEHLSSCALASARVDLDPKILEQIKKMPGASALQLETAPVGTAKLKDYFSRYFGARGGTVQFLNSEDDYLFMSVRGLRGQVIPGANRHEKLKISLNFHRDSAKEIVRCILDGEWDSGLGALPPRDDDFKPMEMAHEHDFAAQILEDLKDYLAKGGGA